METLSLFSFFLFPFPSLHFFRYKTVSFTPLLSCIPFVCLLLLCLFLLLLFFVRRNAREGGGGGYGDTKEMG